MRWKTLIGLTMAACLVGCGGEAPVAHQLPPEPQQAKNDVPVAACDTGGMPAACDPVAQTGCPSGTACYVIKNMGTACVCPGEVEVGGECNTTSECAPGSVCAGTKAPGVCSATCDPAAEAPSCGAGMECLFITAYPDQGYCRPSS